MLVKKIVFLKARVGFQGGLEKYTRFLMDAFVKKGNEVTLLTTGSLLPSKTLIPFSRPNSKFTLYHLLRFDHHCKQWLRKNSQDVVFGMERTTDQTHYRAGNGVHAVFLKRREMVDSPWKRGMTAINPLHKTLLQKERKAFESPHLKILFTNSYMVREEICSHYQTDSRKIQVIHNGVEWKAWESHFEESLTRTPGPYQFLFVGNGYKRKGLHFLLHGLARLKREDFILTVVGKEKDPAYFMALAEKLQLSQKVRFLGPQKKMIPFYQAADALVLPSIYDPFANVTVEALAMGLYVVTSHYNGGSEVLKNNSGTIIEELTSPESMALSLEKALDRPKNRADALNIRMAIKELDFSIQLDKIVQATLEPISLFE